jgi:hypothetical protein
VATRNGAGIQDLRSYRTVSQGRSCSDDPEYAVSYAIISVALTLRELIIFDNAAMFSKLVPMDDDHLREELPRAFLRYLGVEP